LGDASLKQNVEKTVLTTSTRAVLKVKEKEAGHKWLGCMLSAAASKYAVLDMMTIYNLRVELLYQQMCCLEPKCVHQHAWLRLRHTLPSKVDATACCWAQLSNAHHRRSQPAWRSGADPDASTMLIW